MVFHTSIGVSRGEQINLVTDNPLTPKEEGSLIAQHMKDNPKQLNTREALIQKGLMTKEDFNATN